jgi:hypothetical protein
MAQRGMRIVSPWLAVDENGRAFAITFDPECNDIRVGGER